MIMLNEKLQAIYKKYRMGTIGTLEFVRLCNAEKSYLPLGWQKVYVRVTSRAEAAAAAAAADLAEGVEVWRRYGFGPQEFSSAGRDTLHATGRRRTKCAG